MKKSFALAFPIMFGLLLVGCSLSRTPPSQSQQQLRQQQTTTSNNQTQPNNPSNSSQGNIQSTSIIWLPNHRTKRVLKDGYDTVFLDSQHGWKMDNMLGAMGSVSFDLYQTKDGGTN